MFSNKQGKLLGMGYSQAKELSINHVGFCFAVFDTPSPMLVF
jgi:hypothetical protein